MVLSKSNNDSLGPSFHTNNNTSIYNNKNSFIEEIHDKNNIDLNFNKSVEDVERNSLKFKVSPEKKFHFVKSIKNERKRKYKFD